MHRKTHYFFIATTFLIALVIFLCIALPSFNRSHYVVGSPDALTYPPPSISNSNKGKTAEEWRQLASADATQTDTYEKAIQAIRKCQQALCVAEVGYSAEYIDDYYIRIQIPASEIPELTKKDLLFIFCTKEEYQNSLNTPPLSPANP